MGEILVLLGACVLTGLLCAFTAGACYLLVRWALSIGNEREER